jgi:nicotinamide mononucleotide transporter
LFSRFLLRAHGGGPRVSPVEVVGFAFGVWSVWLMTRESVWAWPVGLVNLGAYIVVFRDARLYADMGLQVVYVALCLYGWRHWLHGGGDHDGLRVERAPRAALALSTTLGAAGFFALGAALHALTDASLPFLDSALSSFSLVAQWLQTRKWLENWHAWIAVDAVYVGMYVYKQLYLTAGLYAVFLVLAVIGLRSWRASLAQQAHTVTPQPATGAAA